ncbi:MAG TPA: UDP-N-acetylmuramate dehydrogenase [Oscillospiraceae bacterium]|nr:UDP-N-acetylmuramate dehydrogenase [Oscillospiraceae bacterium]
MYSGLFDIIPAEKIRINENMKLHTTLKIGGPVDIMVIPQTIDDIQKVIGFCSMYSIDYFVFGLGSNLLVSDKGIRKMAIKLGEGLKDIEINETEIYCEAGVRLSQLAKIAAAKGLQGLEFAEGIPGSLGGGIVMNAGAYDGEMKNLLIKVTTVTPNGKLKDYHNADLQMGYRQSVFQNNEDIIVSALLRLNPGETEEIHRKMSEFSARRRRNQPLEYPNAGSTFKRPEGFYVGPMIEKMGLKGYKIGGAQVSTKHAGFIINTGNATADDVLRLIRHIQNKAKQDFGVELHPEIKMVGEM